jgi:hypothetical protein
MVWPDQGKFAKYPNLSAKTHHCDEKVETTLHRQLKTQYAQGEARLEVPLAGYRIDVVAGELLVEVQHGSLAAIRDKVRRLLSSHSVLVIKPLVVRKTLVKTSRRGGEVVERRLSPKRGGPLDIFHELVHFTTVFPHPRLAIECPLVEIEEWRHPGHGRRRRRRARDHQVEDQRLVAVEGTLRLDTAADLLALLGVALPRPFDTAQLAQQLDVDRWIAQRIAYCLRKTGAVLEVGKRGNALLYEAPRRVRRKQRSA